MQCIDGGNNMTDHHRTACEIEVEAVDLHLISPSLPYLHDVNLFA
jgi:hypothetical protein